MSRVLVDTNVVISALLFPNSTPARALAIVLDELRWAAVESVQTLPAHTRIGALRDRVAERRGRNIGAVAAARAQVEFVFYALRDHHIRALRPRSAA